MLAVTAAAGMDRVSGILSIFVVCPLSADPSPEEFVNFHTPIPLPRFPASAAPTWQWIFAVLTDHGLPGVVFDALQQQPVPLPLPAHHGRKVQSGGPQSERFPTQLQENSKAKGKEDHQREQ